MAPTGLGLAGASPPMRREGWGGLARLARG